jgi:hypothetical protein
MPEKREHHDQPAKGPGSHKDPVVRVRQTFMRRVQERFYLRFHMSLILLATALSGVLFAKLMLLLHVDNIVLRYPLAVLSAYLAFFLFVKLWLKYLTASQPLKGLDPVGDGLPDLPNFSGGSGSGSVSPSFGGGGGGASGGGGATGSFNGPMGNVQAAFIPPSSEGPGSSTGVLDAAGDAVSGSFDDDGIVLIALGILLAATVGGAIYLIYIAPHILSEAAFDFLLGTSLIRSYRKMNQPDWMGSVFRDTYKPFLAVLAIAFSAAWVIHAHDPAIKKISDIFGR